MANFDLSREEASLPAPHPRTLSPPFVRIANIHNFRALSAYPLTPSSCLRSSLIFRSAEPSPITAAGTTALHSLGIRTIYDLRSAAELVKNAALTPVVDIPGTERVFVPVFSSDDDDDTHSGLDNATRLRCYLEPGGPQGFVKAYAEILTAGRTAYRVIFEHILARPREPFLVHCTAGKDRTGVLVALVLKLAGVADAEVAREYALTEQGLEAWMESIVEALLRDERFGGDEAGVRRMLGAKEDTMLAFLAFLEDRWDGAEGYLRKGLGLGEKEVEIIKRSLVDEV